MSASLLHDVAAEQADGLLARTSVRTVARGAALFWEGDAADSLFLIERGHVGVRVGTPDGDEVILRVLGPGDHVGEQALVSTAPRTTSAVALDAVDVRVVGRDALATLRRQHPEVVQVALASMVAHADHLAAALADSYHLSVAERTVRRLCELVRVYGTTGADRVVVPLTQDELAQLTGTARPTLNRTLRALQAEGLVHLGRGRLVLCDVQALQQRATTGLGARAA